MIPWRASRSLRSRLALRTAFAIAGLVTAFALVTLVAVGTHLLLVAEASGRAVAAQVRQESGHRAKVVNGDDVILIGQRPVLSLIQGFDSPLDPRVWLVRDGRVLVRSPNAAGHPPLPRLRGLVLAHRSWRTSVPVRWPGGATAVVAWSLAGDLDLMQDLVTVVLVGAALAGAVGIALGWWVTRWVLGPVDRMTAAAQALLVGDSAWDAAWDLPELSGAPDEFTRLARVLRRMVVRLEERRITERRFLADAAHHLKTPVAILRGNVHLLQSWGDEDPAVRRDSVRAMERATREMDRLMTDLLTLERAGQHAVGSVETVDLAGLLRDVADDAKALAPQLTVSGPPAGGRPVLARVDPESLHRALWALVENALRYTTAGGRVGLGAAVQGPWAEAAIDDSGPGIPEEERPRIWDRFYRGAASRGIAGTGLGLPIAKALVEHQGGSIAVTSNVGQGTRVTIRFPRVDARD